MIQTLAIYLKTYGCQMNEYDSSRMMDLLKSRFACELTEDPRNADLILLNTCSVRNKAEEKMFSDLGRFRIIKEKKPNLIIAVGGCVASHDSEALKMRAPFVDIIFGPQTLHRLPDLYEAALSGKRPVIDIRFPEIEKFDALPPPQVNAPSAYVSIMEGCNNFCSYCIVPFTRGREISRSQESIMQEIHSLIPQQVREIMLLGQNVNHYQGIDTHGHSINLANLLHEIAKIPEIGRLRFMTSHPAFFDESLIFAYRDIPKLASHLHLPVQSGSNEILRRMKRGYTREQFEEKIEALRAMRPDISIGADFIVGFPGETEKDFAETLTLAEKIQFDSSYCFMYSPRPGTAAAKIKDDVPLKTKKERLYVLQKTLSTSAEKIGHDMLNTTQSILVTETSKKNPKKLSGRTENNRVVNFLGYKKWIGQFVRVKIIEVSPYSLAGELLETP